MVALDLPVPGETPGPLWAEKLIDALTALNSAKVETGLVEYADLAALDGVRGPEVGTLMLADVRASFSTTPGASTALPDGPGHLLVHSSRSRNLNLFGWDDIIQVIEIQDADAEAAARLERVMHINNSTETYAATSAWRIVTSLPPIADLATGSVLVVGGLSPKYWTVKLSTPAATGDTIAIRDGSGRLAVGAPNALGDAANKGYVDDAIGRYVGINTQTGTTYTPVLADQGKFVTLTNASAITVTLPQDSSVALPIGAQIDFQVRGVGMATFVAGTGATVDGTPSLVTRAQYSAVTAIKVAASTWTVIGDLA